ncbi:MAG: NAD(P)H-dependent oxidoreductase [Actinomycetota bacterium]
MKVLAIPATNSNNGLNRQLIAIAQRAIADLAPDAGIEIVDLNDYEMPIYSTAREQETGIPEPARHLFDKIGAADALIVSFAEYNGSYTSAWKNVHDWMSRIDMSIYQGTRTAMFAATPGPRAGAGVLGSATTTAPFFGADLVGSLGIGTFHANVVDGEIVDDDLRTQFVEILEKLVTVGES